jgi:hypothetical protein
MPLKSDAGQVLVDPSAFAGPEPDPDLRASPNWRYLVALEPSGEIAVEQSASACPGGHQNPPGQKFCGECGQSVEPQPKWRCGHDNAAANKFCGECGGPAFALPVAGAGLATELAAQVGGLLGESRAGLMAELAGGADSRPLPEYMLDEAGKDARRKAHAAAVAAGSAMPPLRYVASEKPQQVIHFIANGLTWAGESWYLGQEIHIGPDHPRWTQAQAWINLTDFEQVERYGEVKFRQGPWPGLSYADALRQQQRPLRTMDKSGEVLLPDEDALRKADEAEKRRRGAVPVAAF